jgi:hypothetical protein
MPLHTHTTIDDGILLLNIFGINMDGFVRVYHMSFMET